MHVNGEFRRISVGLLTLVLAACGAPAGTSSPTDTPSTPGPTTTTTTAPETAAPVDLSSKVVCYLSIVAAHPYATPFSQSLEATVAAAGPEVITLFGEIDVQKQADQMNDCISRGVDVIDIVAADSKGIIPSLIRAKEANIPVLQSGAPPDPDGLQYIVGFTGPSDERSGQAAAEMLNDALGGTGNVVIIQGVAGFAPTLGRLKGFQDKSTELGAQFTILDQPYADFNQQLALNASRDLLTRFGDQIDGVYAQDDTMAAGFVQAYKESGLTKKIIVVGGGGGTKDAFEFIKEGSMYGTTQQSPIKDGVLAGETILKILMGESVPQYQYIDQPIITLENIDQFEPSY